MESDSANRIKGLMETNQQPIARRSLTLVLCAALVAGVLSLAAMPLRSMKAGASAGTPTLSAGEYLYEGQAIRNGSFFATLQNDGNFVLYNGTTPLWASNTHSNSDPNVHLVMQFDGNLVLYTAANAPVWATGTSGSNAFLVLQNDANMVLYSNPAGSPKPVWATNTVVQAPAPPAPAPPAPTPSTQSNPAVLAFGQVLSEGHALVAGSFTAVLQTDGNFVLYNGHAPLWATNTHYTFDPQVRLVMQYDGNLVLYNPSNVPLWSTGTSGSNPFLVLQTDANMVLYSNPSPGSNIPKWASNTTATGIPSTVGVYAYPNAAQALGDRWNSIGVTAALGTPGQPWTGYAQGDDYQAGLATRNAGRGTPWLSFWTVSGPQNGGCAGSSTFPNVPSTPGVLGTNSALWQGQQIRTGSFHADMQYDGNFVVYNGSTPLWSSNTVGKGGNRVVMQGDGNLVIYKPDNTPVWASGGCISSTTSAAPFLVIQNDGNLVSYFNNNWPIWSSVNDSPPRVGTPAQFYTIGYTAGVYAANTIAGYGLGILPTYEILDPEGYPDNHSGLDVATSAQWQQMMAGWAAGLGTVAGMHPAFYAAQYEYTQFNLASINMPFFVAVAFGFGNGTIIPPSRLSGVNGSNIVGVTAFYSGVPGSVQCSSVVTAANDIANWGYRFNTLQFDPGLRCPA